MLFTHPVDFREALASSAVRSVLPNTLSSRELGQLDPALLERARFSAGVTRIDFIDRFDALAEAIVQPRTLNRVTPEGTIQMVTEGMDFASARLELKNFLRSIQYRPEEGQAGTIQDLSSDGRLNLILQTNVQQMQGYGGWIQGQNAAVLEQWPASELYRAEQRHEPRDWPVRWLSAAGEVGDGEAAAALRRFGRMIARKDSKMITAVNRFKVPYAPLDFNSGMDWKDVDRKTAISVGVYSEGAAAPQPQTRGLNELLQANVAFRNAALRSALLEDVGDEFEFEGDVLKKKDGARGATRPTTIFSE